MNFRNISVVEARLLLEAQGPGRVQIVDIRDDQSYAHDHIDTAVHLHNSNLQEFIDNADLKAPVLVYCYHGLTSQSAAAYLAEQGFSDTYSLEGGFEAWKHH
ncbi:MAG: thiosulfate sulfurtransferase GlpE [Proteobacteria bacterium]|nr:thiosulfate sulfurtransferase GlpE [Pseudomonadota bacterium]